MPIRWLRLSWVTRPPPSDPTNGAGVPLLTRPHLFKKDYSMTWSAEAPYKPEVQKCRYRLISYCQGIGLDIGCGPEKIRPEAIGVDVSGKGDINCDIARGIDILSDNFFDYIFSSHCLEDLEDTEFILRDWWKKLKVGGNLILYLPHKSFYPNIGQPGANKNHKHDFLPEDIVSAMGFASYDILHQAVHGGDDEYSFEFVFKKISEAPGYQLKPIHIKEPKALVVRYGAFGDAIIMTPLLKRLKEDGYHVTLNNTKRSIPVLKNNPHIDHYFIQEEDVIPKTELTEYWEAISEGYDKFINLSETLEVKFLTVPARPEYNLPIEERRARCGHTNYYDYALEVGGYKDVERPKGELFFDPVEEGLCQNFKRRFKDYFTILWCLSGSSLHKAWLGAEETALNLLYRHNDILILTVGDYACKLLEWRDERTISMIDEWDIRTTMLMTKYVDLVISPETGILNAAGCFDTPKIGLLTHSNKTNLTKYFKNDYSMQAHIDCSPCHRMIYLENMKDCPMVGGGFENGGANLCACGDSFSPKKVVQQVEEIYGYWRAKRRSVPIIRPGNTRGALYGPDGKTMFSTKRVSI